MEYIQVDNQPRPFRFSLLAIKKLCKLTESKLSELGQVLDDIDNIITMIHIGFEMGAKKEGIKIDFSRKDIEQWLDDDYSILEQAMEIFSNSMSSGKK